MIKPTTSYFLFLVTFHHNRICGLAVAFKNNCFGGLPALPKKIPKSRGLGRAWESCAKPAQTAGRKRDQNSEKVDTTIFFDLRPIIIVRHRDVWPSNVEGRLAPNDEPETSVQLLRTTYILLSTSFPLRL